jgi:hypothetical protein
MKIVDLIQNPQSKKPIELIYCLQSTKRTDIAGDNVPIWRTIDSCDRSEDFSQIKRLSQYKIDDAVYDLIEVTNHEEYRMLMLGHWNDGESL